MTESFGPAGRLGRRWRGTPDIEPAFALKNVSKAFNGFRALEAVDLEIQPGEMVALVGPSGAGKTTLLNLLNGSLSPTAGEVWIAGRDVSGLSARALRQVQSRIGTVYQQFHLVDNLRVIHNVNAGMLGRWSTLKATISLVRPTNVEAARRALAQVGIPDKLYTRTGRLSGGEQQRVALARVLLQDPAAILADEPISSVDPEHGRRIMDLLRRLNREAGKTVIVSLHAVHFACSHCQRIVGVRRGRVEFDLPSSDVSAEMAAALYRAGEEAGAP
jgi:phosphonate transport system ATP-binding protein